MKTTKEKMAFTIKLIRIIGLMFIAAGFTFAWFPEKVDDYLPGLSEDNMQYTGAILIVIGMVDILILPRILNIKNNETK